MKGDRRSPVKKLSWRFRTGAKLTATPSSPTFSTSFRRSRLDYRSGEKVLLSNNSGFEYTLDLDRRTLSAIRHYFFFDKKWPIKNGQLALTLAVDSAWESARKYTRPLAEGNGTSFQFLLRPNIEG